MKLVKNGSLILFLLHLLFPGNLFAQETEVRGKITDAISGDPIPFANVLFKGTTLGVTSDFDGNFLLKAVVQTDSITVTSVGYKPKTKAVKPGKQIINFQLEEAVTGLKELVIASGENPAFGILRKIVNHKNRNDKRSLHAYEYESYTKTEIDVNRISEKLRQKKTMKKIAQVLDSIDRVVGEDGKPVLPLSVSEATSKFYYRSNPSVKTEHILNTRFSGVGFASGSAVTQLVGASFQEYNFYQNWLDILGKNFVSPIADSWRFYYDYDLTDSVYVGNDFCYRLDFFPISPAELAFSGTMWIRKEDYALRQIDASVSKRANINFIDKIQIQQELMPTPAGPWLPRKSRVLINVSELSKNSAGLLAKFYSSNKNPVINQPHENSFYDKRVNVAEDAAQDQNEKLWDSLRHEPLSASEKNVYRMIDTLKNIPIVRTYIDVIKVVVQGYYNFGEVEVGPYAAAVASNTVEGTRMQLGFRTNSHFSRKMVYTGSVAYGFTDMRTKFSLGIRRILSRQHWTTVGIRYSRDILRLGLDLESIGNNPIFVAASHWGRFTRAYYYDEFSVYGRREFIRGLSGRASFRHWSFVPTYNFGFPSDPDNSHAAILNQFKSAEGLVEVRYARTETYFQGGNERVNVGNGTWPAITLRYTRGFKGIAGSDFAYDKLRLNIDQRIKMGVLGNGFLTLTSEHVFNQLPYPLLTVHLGNQAPTYTPFTFNLMNFGEFVSDQSVSMHYRQYFEGLLLNRVPLLNRMKWRLVGTANMIYGSLRNSNRLLISETTPNGNPALHTGYFSGNIPYLEMGYGVENIFSFLRIDFVHRLTYLQNPDARKFGVLLTAQFRL
ncbi:MAG: carboxypeptidase-like regulatory domain-containing protein [Bacteroidetes bacterium]|nr:carboxypeptidase-like regulatory domain-containing protein [Bacteroidota bacterium]